MKTWQKFTFASVAVAIVGAIAFAFMAYDSVRKTTIPDAYAQWASAEMVIAFRKKMDRMPNDWDELASFYDLNSPHNGGLAFEEIRDRIIINFSELPKLELVHANSVVPEIIRAKSGIQAHWEEPNQLVNRETRK